jgi:hypothetical protein
MNEAMLMKEYQAFVDMAQCGPGLSLLEEC